MSENRIQAYQYFQTGDIPTESQFQFVFNNIWFKDEKFSMSDITGLSTAFEKTLSVEQLNNHISDELAHTNYLVKKDGSNIDVDVWKALLDIVRIATVDEGVYSGNVFTKEQVQAVFDDITTNVDNIRNALISNDLNLDELQEVVNFIKKNREDIELLKQISVGNTKDDKVELVADYLRWGALNLQNQFNDVVYDKIQTIESGAGTRETIIITEDSFFTHNLNSYDFVCEAYDTVTLYKLPLKIKIVDANNIYIAFDSKPTNNINVTIKKI